MITEDYVSFEIARLLKEKGFDWPCEYAVCEGGIKYTENAIDCPTLQMAMKWLREKHIIIVVKPDWFNLDYDVTSWKYVIWFDDNAEEYLNFSSYEEAVEKAINYALENLD